MFGHSCGRREPNWGRPPASPDAGGRRADPPPATSRPLAELLPPARNWWEVFLLALCVFSGIGTLVKPPSLLPNLERALPPLVLAGWSWSLVAGGAIALLGVVIGPKSLGLLIERAGLLILLGACLSYPLALALSAGVTAWDRVVVIGAFAVVIGQRVVRITRLVHLVTRGGAA